LYAPIEFYLQNDWIKSEESLNLNNNSDPTKFAIFWSHQKLINLIMNKKQNGEDEGREGRKLIILQKKFLSHPVGVAMDFNQPIFEAIKYVVNCLHTGGLIQHAMKNDFDDKYSVPEPEIQGLKVLCYDDLNYGFIIWLAACGISTIVFMCEIIIFSMRKLIKKLCCIVKK
jgi:hypothetical protein